jgi:hypothetical protein
VLRQLRRRRASEVFEWRDRIDVRPGPSQLFQVRARQDCAWSLKEFDSSRFECHRGASLISPLTPLRLLRDPKAPAPTEMTASMLLRRCFLPFDAACVFGLENGKAPFPGPLPYRGDRTRTCNPRFWRPVLYQVELRPWATPV